MAELEEQRPRDIAELARKNAELKKEPETAKKANARLKKAAGGKG